MIPGFLEASRPTSREALDEYRLRFDIEESFLDEKSGGYQIQTSELATRALERLILAIITLHLTSIGVGVVHAGKRSFRGYPLGSWRCRYLKIEWRWREPQYQCGWQAFAPFYVDPAPDPLPAIARVEPP